MSVRGKRDIAGRSCQVTVSKVRTEVSTQKGNPRTKIRIGTAPDLCDRPLIMITNHDYDYSSSCTNHGMITPGAD